MVVNFKGCGISGGARKLGRTSTLKKKKRVKTNGKYNYWEKWWKNSIGVEEEDNSGTSRVRLNEIVAPWHIIQDSDFFFPFFM